MASGAIIAFGVWVWFSTNLAGEIRSAGTRSNWYSMLSGLAITFGSITLMVILLYHTVGQQFLTAVNGIAGDPEVYTLPNEPWWITLVAAIHTNTIFVAFLGLTFLCWAPLIVYIQIVQPVRALFAWAFDQVIPEKLAAINPRTHTPVVSLALVGLIAIPSLYAAAYTTSFFKYIALSTIVGFPVFMLVGIGAILFPYRKKAAYEASVSNIDFLGLPLMVLFGVGSILAGLFGAWLWFAYAKLGLPNAGKSVADQLFTTPGNGGLSLIACCLIVGGLIYFVSRAVREAQGIDLVAHLPRAPARVRRGLPATQGGGGQGARLRLYYASDIHGTEVLWRKFLHAPGLYKAPVIVMGGDVTGKVVIPLVEDRRAVVTASSSAARARRARRRSWPTLEHRIRANGMYPYVMTPEEVERVAGLTEEEREPWFAEVMLRDVLALDRAGGRAARRPRRAVLRDARQRRPDGRRRAARGARSASRPATTRVVDFDRLHDALARLLEPHAVRLAARARGGRAVPPRRGAGRRRSRTSRAASSTCTCRRTTRGLDTAPELDEDLNVVLPRQGAEDDPGGLDGGPRADRALPADRGLHGHVHESRGRDADRAHARRQPGQRLPHGPHLRRASSTSRADRADYQFVIG